MTFDGTTYYVTDLSYAENASKTDITDTGTQGDGTEFYYSRVERPITVSMWKDSLSTGPVLRTKKACTISFEGSNYAGSASFESKTVAASLNSGVKLDLSGVFEGSVIAS
jgi:hypothetical protein